MTINSIQTYIKKISKGDTKDLLSGSAISVVSKFSELVLRYVFIIILARMVGAEEMGRYSLTIGTVMVIVAIGQLGLNTAIVKIGAPLFAQKKFDEIKTLTMSVYWKLFLFGTIASVLLFVLAGSLSAGVFQKPYLTQYFQAFAFTIIPFLLIYLQSQGFKASKNIATHSFTNDLSIPLFNLIFLIVGSTFLDGGALVRFFYVAGPLCASFIVTSLWLKESHFLQIKKSSVSFEEEIRKVALPLITTIIATQVLSWGDILFIGRLYPDSDMAIYNVAMRVAAFVTIPLLAIETITASQISASFKDANYGKLASQTQRATMLTIMYAIPIFLFFIIFGKYFLLLFGQEFVAAYSLMMVLLVGQLINVITGPVGLVLLMTDQQKVYKNIVIVSAVISLLLNALLIPQFGIWGASWAIMLGIGIKNVAMYGWVKYHFGFYSLDARYIVNKVSQWARI